MRAQIRRECMATARRCWKQIALLEREDAADERVMQRLHARALREGAPIPLDPSEVELQEGRRRLANLLQMAAKAGQNTTGGSIE